jgi:hypothetical protein
MKGSLPCTQNAMTNMVPMIATAAARVKSPMASKIPPMSSLAIANGAVSSGSGIPCFPPTPATNFS